MNDQLPNDIEELSLELIQTDLDDESPEIIGEVIGRVLQADALDAVAVPVTMKKGRPSVRIEVLVTPEHRNSIVAMLLRETSTLGVRVFPVTRFGLARTVETVEVLGHQIRIKVALWNGKALKAKPEFEDCRAAAEATGKPVREIMALARKAANLTES